ncbi:Rid family hydrolase [Streptomyces sp. GESEQ-35]|uniref:Rid family hydrolase n=1 Tax=Streptomyces sp. GESEQ-35 TaxID=2812657 RepID=UPI001B31DC6F|nr:Rid family hydrolase [Streptomyces sp. GESEQ-35]
MTDLTRIPAPDGVAAAAQYSHVVMGTGRFVAVSGQLALDEDGKLIGEGAPAAQAHQIFENLRRCLAAASAVQVASLVRPEFLMEIEAFAVLPS